MANLTPEDQADIQKLQSTLISLIQMLMDDIRQSKYNSNNPQQEYDVALLRFKLEQFLSKVKVKPHYPYHITEAVGILTRLMELRKPPLSKLQVVANLNAAYKYLIQSRRAFSTDLRSGDSGFRDSLRETPSWKALKRLVNRAYNIILVMFTATEREKHYKPYMEEFQRVMRLIDQLRKKKDSNNVLAQRLNMGGYNRLETVLRMAKNYPQMDEAERQRAERIALSVVDDMMKIVQR